MKTLLLFFILFVQILNANRLESSTSPYLLQHMNNPVDWYEWNEKTFIEAKKQNKLIFLSIGYSTCHWCHVMAHESFEDKEVAKILNKDYISIKVDREELPHIDGYYQKIYRTMNKKSGGWPLTIIMTADKEPVFSATYVPKYAGYGSRGLIEVVDEIALMDKQELSKMGQKVIVEVNKNEQKFPSNEQYNNKLLKDTVAQFKTFYDDKNKGFAIDPKFPEFAKIIMLLKIYNINGDKEALQMALEPLRTMAKGGIYDQIDGGFYRYAVDNEWLLPHFEKMLYTNSESLEAYTLAYQITKEPLFKKVIDETIQEMDKRFKEDNLYKSASNADSKNDDGENEEGYYFMVEYEGALEYMIQNKMSEKDAHTVLTYLGIVEDGTFDGDLSNPEITSEIVPKNFEKGMVLLKQMRAKKEYPFIDNKINTAWNALHIKGMLIASKLDNSYKKRALSSLDSLLDTMYKNGVLYHQTIKGIEPTQKAILEDFAFLSSALFEAYQLTLEKKYFQTFEQLLKLSIEQLYKNERWYDSSDGFKTFSDIKDYGYASALGVHFHNLLLYATMQSDMKIFNIVQKSMQYYVNEMNQTPTRFPNASLASIYFQIEPVIIKSNKQNLEKIEDKSFTHPFVYKMVYDTNQYLACKLNTCFSYSKDLKKVTQSINGLR